MNPPSSRPAATVRRERHPGRIPASAVIVMVIAVFLFAVVDSMHKYLAQRYPVAMITWGRWAVQTLLLLIWVGPHMGTSLFRTRQLPVQLARGALLIASAMLFMTALRYMPLADATAIHYSNPTLVVILAVLFLDERMTRARLVAIVACIAGMLLIVRPGAAVFQEASLFALAAAACHGTFQILTRKLAGEDPRVLLFYPALIGTLALTLVMPWIPLPGEVRGIDIAMIVGCGGIGTLSNFLFILAFQRAPASGITTFSYVHLVWATLVGWVVFGDLPDGPSFAGMAVIAGSGLLLAWYEQRRPVAAP